MFIDITGKKRLETDHWQYGETYEASGISYFLELEKL